MNDDIDDSARIVDAEVGDSMLREFVTIHDSTIGDDCGVYRGNKASASGLDPEGEADT